MNIYLEYTGVWRYREFVHTVIVRWCIALKYNGCGQIAGDLLEIIYQQKITFHRFQRRHKHEQLAIANFQAQCRHQPRVAGRGRPVGNGFTAQELGLDVEQTLSRCDHTAIGIENLGNDRLR